MHLEVRGGDSLVEDIKSVIKETAGEGAWVRSVQQMGLVEVRDISCWADKDEVTEALSKAGITEARVVNLRKTFGGAQAVTVVVPLQVARDLAGVGRLKIGLVNFRVSFCEKIERCFRCLAKGHEFRDFSDPDRRQCCRRFGCEGYFAANCSAESRKPSRQTIQATTGARNGGRGEPDCN